MITLENIQERLEEEITFISSYFPPDGTGKTLVYHPYSGRYFVYFYIDDREIRHSFSDPQEAIDKYYEDKEI